PPPVEVLEIELERKTQLCAVTLLPPPAKIAPPLPPKPTELPWKRHESRIGAPFVMRRPPPSPCAKLPVKIRCERVGEAPLTHMPAPRSLLAAGAPSACPAVIVKPSRTPVLVTDAAAVTTW